MRAIRVLLIAAVIVGALTTEAKASPPLGWPGDVWTCNVPTQYCLKLVANGPLTTRALYLEGQGVSDGGQASATGSGFGWRMSAVSGSAYTAISQTGRGGDVVSQLNDGIVSSTQSATRSGVVGQNTSGSGAPGFWSNAQYWGAGYNVNSARSLKRDFAASPYGAAEVLKLRPTSYVLKADPTGARRVGLIAEEVEAVMPLAVHEGPDKNKGIDMYAVTVALIETVQALEKRITELEAAVRP